MQWISIVQRTVLEGTAKVLLNSVSGRNIQLRRGVRQGDPLAPYLFILAMDFLATWFQLLVQRGMFNPPLNECKQCLLYADDTLFIIQPQPQQLRFLKIVLNIFGDLSGLQINMEKSEFLMTAATTQQTQERARILGCKASAFPLKYLGMPLSDRRLSKAQYDPLIKKIENKLPAWKAETLSIGGRITLINAVLTAMPLYFMSTFILPKWVIKKIDKVRRKFLWHGHKEQQQHKRYMSLVAWETVIMPKEQGGLGIKNLEIMNQALMGKIMWNWLQVTKPWWMHIVQTENYPWDLLTATPLWKSLQGAKNFIISSVSYGLGSGTYIKFWRDSWCGRPLMLEYPDLYQQSMAKNMTVREARHQGRWELQLQAYMSTQIQDQAVDLLQMLQNMVIAQQQTDKAIWNWNTNGNYSVKSYYTILTQHPTIRDTRASIWKIKAPHRVMVFTWLMLRKRILTVDNLVRRGWHLPNRCCLCKREEETVDHLFMHCSYTLALRAIIISSLPLADCMHFNSNNYRKSILESHSKHIRRIQIVICFATWRERCRRIFSDKQKSPSILFMEIAAEYRLWFPEAGTPNTNP